MNKVKITKILKWIVIFVIGIFTGFFIAYILRKYFGDFIETYITNTDGFGSMIKMYGLFLLFVIGYLFHIIVHEGGHLVFGLLTGYSFVSFRVGSFIIIKEEDKFKLKRYNLPGTAGQCLMMPPELEDDKIPFVIYNYGGAIMNLIVSIIGILMAAYIRDLPIFLKVILVLFGFGGIFAALTNAIPLKIGGISNDGHNVVSMLKDKGAKRGFFLQLKVNGLQHQGIRIKDLPLEWFTLKEKADITKPLNTSIRLIEHTWHLDNGDLESAKKVLDSFLPYLNRLIPIYRFEINCERIFLELLGDCDKKLIDRLYDKELKKYVKRAKFMLSKKRLNIAYEGIYNEDKDKSLELYKEFKELVRNSPNKGDANIETSLVDLVMEKL